MADADRYRPQWHFSAKRNWINDPNGLVYFDGEYHLFYQYNPFGDQWGHMSWGHAVSTDLLHWQELPVAIPEDDRVSIFSGSVVIDEANTSGFGDGKTPVMVAIYTGCLRRPEGGQAQELAYSHDRGRSWTKFVANPVLDLGLTDFRDPKVFWHTDTQRWIMLVSLAHEYRLAFFASNNLKDWTFLSDFKSEDTQQGIWECPDIFEMPLAGEASVWVLKVDVLEGHPSHGSGARLFWGHFDGTRFHLGNIPAPAWADYGSDFYAAVAWGNTEHVRPTPVWIGWMNCHRYAKHLPTSPWRGVMSMPRALSLRRTATGLEFLQQPIPELTRLRGKALVNSPAEIQDSEYRLTVDPCRRSLELHMACEQSSAQSWGGYLRTGKDEILRWGYDNLTSEVFVDRSTAGFVPDDRHYAKRRSAAYPAPRVGLPVRLRIFLDQSSVELFAGEGELVLTEQFFPEGHEFELGLFSNAGTSTFTQVTVWPLHTAL